MGEPVNGDVRVQPRQPNAPAYPYGLYKHLPGTSGTSGVGGTFMGPRDRAYVDFHARDLTRTSGKNAWYYPKEDQNRRIDGDRPLSDARPERNQVTDPESTPADPFARHNHAGFALYGENARLGRRLDSVTREIIPDWPYLQPILVRGVLYEVEHSQEPDERGAIYVREGQFDLARVLCETEWDFQPRPGDVVRFDHLGDLYMDVEDVSRDESRFGSTGFFAVYKCRLVKSSKYDPSRKIAERKLVGPPPDSTVDHNPGELSPGPKVKP